MHHSDFDKKHETLGAVRFVDPRTPGGINHATAGLGPQNGVCFTAKPDEQTVEDLLDGQIRELNRRISALCALRFRLSNSTLDMPVSLFRELNNAL